MPRRHHHTHAIPAGSRRRVGPHETSAAQKPIVAERAAIVAADCVRMPAVRTAVPSATPTTNAAAYGGPAPADHGRSHPAGTNATANCEEPDNPHEVAYISVGTRNPPRIQHRQPTT